MIIIFFILLFAILLKIIDTQIKIERYEEEIKRKKYYWDLYAGQTV
jgi:hypothetical protein